MRSNLNVVRCEVCTEVITDLYLISSLSPLKFCLGRLCFAQSITFVNVPSADGRTIMECLDYSHNCVFILLGCP